MLINFFNKNNSLSYRIKYPRLSLIIFSQIYLTQTGTLVDTTTPGLSGPGSNANEGVISIPQSLTSWCRLMPYLGGQKAFLGS